MQTAQECGFVNFVAVQDAIAAKEDVLNRLGGRLLVDQGPLRIGFGRDSGSPARSTPSPMAVAPAAEFTSPSIPTRALWVNLISPATTTDELLSYFTPFGPIESARVLPQKSCAVRCMFLSTTCRSQLTGHKPVRQLSPARRRHYSSQRLEWPGHSWLKKPTGRLRSTSTGGARVTFSREPSTPTGGEQLGTFA